MELDFEVRCPECFTDVSRGAPCSICRDGGRCCPCVHEDTQPTDSGSPDPTSQSESGIGNDAQDHGNGSKT